MIWLTWRQMRTQTWITVAALVGLGGLLLVGGQRIAAIYHDSGVAGCAADCGGAIDAFLYQATSGWLGDVLNATTAIMYVTPALIGLFWGAPMVARELEAGTHRLAWNQSVSRGRWLATKLIAVGGLAMVTMALLTAGVTWFAQRVDHARLDRLQPLMFGARGVVPIAYAAFAFSVGVAAGMFLRRTVPAMAATLAIYVAAVASMVFWVRAHLLPATHIALPLDVERINGIQITESGHLVVTGDAGSDLPGAWIVSNHTVTASGADFVGPADPHYCGAKTTSPRTCLEWIGSLDLRQSVTYHPANHFWALQWIEAGIFFSLAVLVGAVCLQWTRRRLV